MDQGPEGTDYLYCLQLLVVLSPGSQLMQGQGCSSGILKQHRSRGEAREAAC